MGVKYYLEEEALAAKKSAYSGKTAPKGAPENVLSESKQSENYADATNRPQRLLRRADFLRLGNLPENQGLKCITSSLITLASSNRKQCTRVGFTISKKVGKAVERNLVRRRLKALELELASLFMPLDYVFIVRAGAAEISFPLLKEEMRKSLTQIAKKHKKSA